MATVIEQKRKPEKFSSLVDEQIAQASSRILMHDLSFGALCLAALTASYATITMLIDKSLNLSEWFRQLSLLGFCIVFGAVAYRLIVRPLRSRVNPLYAASRVEQTIEDAKNSVTGYVDAQEKGNIHTAIKTAMSARAAQAVGHADVNRTVDHRSLQIAGGMFVFLLLTLIALFFIFRPNQFKSLLGRSFVPFSSDPIASRTQLTLTKPDPAEPTITTGQTINVAVHIGGKVPAKDGPEHARVLIRHNQADSDYEEVALKEGENSRDWAVKIPEDLVLNGFWYKVAAGDAETPEYRVTVRSLPLFTGFEATYEYPAYTHKPSDRSFSSEIRACPGTWVTLIARTNREVKDGAMKFEVGGLEPATVKPVLNQPDSLAFRFKVAVPTKYRLFMTTSTGEKNSDPPPYSVAIDSDLPPTVQITRPQELETYVPANGQLAVDGAIGDDYGIDKVRLRFKVNGQDLTPLPYMSGQSFQRAKDNTWPRNLDYKDSADLTKLTYVDGSPYEPKEGDVLDYWLEAIDNCSEAKPVADWNKQVGNVGRSNVLKLRLLAPKKNDEKQQLDQQKNERKNEERQHNQQQQQKFNNENREQKPQNGDRKAGENRPDDNQDPNSQPMQDPNNAKPGDDKNGMGNGDPMNQNPDKSSNPDAKTPQKQQPNNADSNQRQPNNQNDPRQSDPKNGQQGNGNPGGQTDPNKQRDPNAAPNSKPMKQDPNNGDMAPPMGGAKNQDPSGKPNGGMDQKSNPMQGGSGQQDQDEKKAEEDASKVQQELEKNRRPEGEAKNNPSVNPEERTDPATRKPQPMNGGQNSQPQDSAKPDAGADKPTNGNNTKSSETKPQGNLEKPGDPAGDKPNPNQGNQKNQKPNSPPPSENREQPLGGAPGEEKAEPKPNPDKTDPKQEVSKEQSSEKDASGGQKDPTSGSTAKPATHRPQDMQEKGNDNGQSQNGQPQPGRQQPDPAKSAAKPKPQPPANRGDEKDSSASNGEQQNNAEKAATPKPKEAPEPAAAKPSKSQDGQKNEGAEQTKPEPGTQEPGKPQPGQKPGNGSESKPDKGQAPMNSGEKNPPEKGMNTPQNQGAQNGGQKSEEVEKGIDKSEQANPQKGANEPKKGNERKNKQSGEAGSDDNRGKPPIDPRKMEELKNAAKDLNNPDPKKREEARDKLDKSIGEQNRKSLEELQKKEREKIDQLQKDAQSSDESKRQAAQKQLDDMRKQTDQMNQKKLDEFNKRQQKSGDGQKDLDRQQLDELKKNAQDLNSDDPKKREEARDKLDKSIGEQNRKALEDYQKQKQEEFEQLKKDLQSQDKATREAAEKKAQDLMKQAAEEAKKEKERGQGNRGQEKQEQEKQGNGKEPSPEELRDLVNKAKDLNSKDDAKRKEAEKALDEKIGKESREKLQDELKKKSGEMAGDKTGDKKTEEKTGDKKPGEKPEQKPGEEKPGNKTGDRKPGDMPGGDQSPDQDLRKKIEQQAREHAGRGSGKTDPEMPRGQPGASEDKVNPPIADDPRSRAKAAELQLEDFEKNRYNKELQDKLGWSQEKYDEFLKAQQKRVEQLQKEALTLKPEEKPQPTGPSGPPSITAGGATKVETRGNGTKGSATSSGSVNAAPGFENSKLKFAEALDKIQPKKP